MKLPCGLFLSTRSRLRKLLFKGCRPLTGGTAHVVDGGRRSGTGLGREGATSRSFLAAPFQRSTMRLHRCCVCEVDYIVLCFHHQSIVFSLSARWLRGQKRDSCRYEHWPFRSSLKSDPFQSPGKNQSL